MSKGKPKIFSLANLLVLLGALAFGLVCFWGGKVYNLGDNTPIAIPVVITLLLSVFAIGAGAFKRAGSNFAVSLMLEIIFLLAFTILTIIVTYVSYSPLSQYFTDSEQKTEKPLYSPFQQYFVVSERKEKICTSIAQTEKMLEEYKSYVSNRENNYKGKLSNDLKKKFQIDNNIRSFNEKIGDKDTAVFKQQLKQAQDSIKKLKWYNNLKWWYLPSLTVDIVKDVKQKSYDKQSSLVTLSKDSVSDEPPIDPFSYELSFKEMDSYFTTPDKPRLFSIATGVAILLYILMLTPYLFSKRSKKPTVLKKTEEDNYKNRKDTKIDLSAINS
jgi:hypothetical protein